MKVNYQLVILLLVVFVVLVLWNRYLPTIDLTYTEFSDSYKGITVGDNKTDSLNEALSGEFSSLITRSRCIVIDSKTNEVSSYDLPPLNEASLDKTKNCGRILFLFSNRIPNYLELSFDNNKVVEIYRFRHWIAP